MPNAPGSKGFESADEKSQPAKVMDRSSIRSQLEKGNTYGYSDSSDKDAVTKPGNGYQGYDGESFNDSEKNASISRLDFVGKGSANCGTAYNSYPIPETYKPATSNGKPDANAVEYKTIEKDRNAA